MQDNNVLIIINLNKELKQQSVAPLTKLESSMHQGVPKVPSVSIINMYYENWKQAYSCMQSGPSHI